LKRKLEKVNLTHVRALFATKKLAFSTATIMLVWAFIGLGYPLYNAFLPYIQATRGADFGDGSTYLTYRNSLIIAVLGIPGAFLGGALVELPRFGRKGTLALSSILTGVFLYASTTAVTSNALLGWNCAFNFFSNIMYAVLYAYTPEIFPTKDRGTGNALTATANRVFGIMAVRSIDFSFRMISLQKVDIGEVANQASVQTEADFSQPIIAMFANLQTSAPVYTSGALFIVAGLLVVILPFEPQGKASL
jgi:MFS family permease